MIEDPTGTGGHEPPRAPAVAAPLTATETRELRALAADLASDDSTVAQRLAPRGPSMPATPSIRTVGLLSVSALGLPTLLVGVLLVSIWFTVAGALLIALPAALAIAHCLTRGDPE